MILHSPFLISVLNYLLYGFYCFFLYFIGIWVFQDADRRGLNGYYWCLICIFFPIGGIPIYLLLRPKSILKICHDCDTGEHDSLLCYYCPHNTSPVRPPFKIYMFYLMKGLLYSACMTVKYFCFLFVNDLYESFFILRSKELKKMNSLLKKYYFLRNPVNMARNTEKEMERPSYSLTYGETPYSTALSIFNMVKVKDNDVFFDLGSGTGNVALFINIYFNIKSTGIDLVSYFIEKSNLIAEEMKLEHIRFIKGDFLEEDLSEGTIFYMNCLTFNQELREKLAEKMNLIKEGSRIISIGYPLAGFNLLEKRTYFFSWGWEDVYIQEK